MSRPKGSKNKTTNDIPTSNQSNNTPNLDNFDIQYNAMMKDLTPEQIGAVFSSFQSGAFNQGITQDMDVEKIQQWLASPEDYKKDLENLAQYYYISNGDIFQLFDLTKVLPTLNYQIKALTKDRNYDKNITLCTKMMYKTNHKELTRDLISQLIVAGTVTGIWLGDKKNPYLMIFDDLEYFFPAYRRNGKWVVWCDLSYFDTLSEVNRQIQLENLSPYITESDYNAYKKDSQSYKYIEIPIEKSICLRTHTTKRNQRFGIPWVTQSLFEVMHKKKLKDLEKSVANKIINAIAVLKIGNTDNPNLKLNTKVKKKVYGGTRQALDKNQSTGVTVIGLPEWTELEFPDMKSDALDPKKFESINDDITSSLGYSKALTNGSQSNFSSAKLNLDIFYRRISVILEDIENEVYAKLFATILPKSIADDYLLIYDKSTPLSTKEKVDLLMRLHNMEGFSLKSVIDQIDGVDWNEYIEQSIHEQENMKLQEKIKPYASAYTSTGDGEAGRPQNDNPDNDSTIVDKTNGGSDMPRTSE